MSNPGTSPDRFGGVDGTSDAAVRALAGRVCLITGASRGIGRGLAERFGSAGVHVVLVARSVELLSEVANGITGRGGKALAVAADVTDPGAIGRAVASAASETGGIDAAVLCAGVTVDVSAHELTGDEWDYVVDTNLKGVFFAAQAAAREMRARGGGIVAISSTLARSAFPLRSVYSASKAGVTQLVRSLALEWAPDAIRVNGIAPTAVITDLTRERFKDPEHERRIVSRIPLGRILEVDDLVPPVAFLAGPEAAMITGQTLFVDGGWSVN